MVPRRPPLRRKPQMFRMTGVQRWMLNSFFSYCSQTFVKGVHPPVSKYQIFTLSFKLRTSTFTFLLGLYLLFGEQIFTKLR
jgi:hypothetical protein